MLKSISFRLHLTILFTLINITAGVFLCRGMENPAAAYCQTLGYHYSTETDDSGNSTGSCLFPDTSRVDAWSFFRGKVGQEYSYCSKKGLQAASRTRFISTGFTIESGICKQPDDFSQKQSNEIELLDLMQNQGDGFIRFPPQRKLHNLSHADEKYSEIPTSELPVTFDWRNQGSHSYVGPIRDQGACGDCYAFGAAAAAEVSYNIFHKKYDKKTVDFSESYIAWCLGTYGPYANHFSGCDGADYEYAELEALTREGVILEQDFPYVEEDPGSCTAGDAPVNIFTKWGRVPANDIAGIKNALMRYGVLDAAIYAPPELIFYSSGVYSDELTTCPDGAWSQTNHAVTLVGWGNDPTFGDYWIVRNSWGTGWGEKGYMKIAMKAARVACSSTYLTYSDDDNRQPSALGPVPVAPILQLLQTKNRKDPVKQRPVQAPEK